MTYIYRSDTNLDQHDILGMMEVGDSSFLYKVRVSLYYKNYSSIYNHQNVLEKCFMKIKCFIIKHNSVDHRWNLRLLKILWDFQKWEIPLWRGLMGARIYLELWIGPLETRGSFVFEINRVSPRCYPWRLVKSTELCLVIKHSIPIKTDYKIWNKTKDLLGLSPNLFLHSRS